MVIEPTLVKDPTSPLLYIPSSLEKTQSKSMKPTAMIMVCKYITCQRTVPYWPLNEKQSLSFNSVLGGTLNS